MTFEMSYTLEVLLRRGRGENGDQALGLDALFLPVVAQLDGGAIEDAAEGDWLDLPVRNGVAEQADAGIHGLLHVEVRGAEILCSDSVDLVVVEIDHLETVKECSDR